MDRIDGRPVYSATDLVAHLACDHLVQLDRAVLAGLVDRPVRDDPELDVIRRRGFEHERRFLDELRAAGRTSVTIELDGSIADRGEELRDAAARTVAAMAAGAEVVYQATFFDGTFRGHADFLLRVDSVERPSIWGAYHYEVADTKLARHVKASAILQICSYVDQLERLQGVRPEWLHVALGGSLRQVERLRVDDFMAYYRTVRDRFLADMADLTTPSYPPVRTYPEPVEHCDVCRWAPDCAIRRRADDHLSLVAGISARQRRSLTERGVTTLAGLGGLGLPMVPPLERTSAHALERVRDQARIQVAGREAGRPLYELFVPSDGDPIDAERGLASLPAPSPGDLSFDIEGDPYALDDGLDYLFGVLDRDDRFTAIWSTDDAGDFTLEGERRAFERLIDLIVERLDSDPDMHVYHYAPYEPTALKRLMGRYGTREAEVDRLLRGGVMVDLLRVVRQSLRASVESYSIKRMEAFYGFEREIDLRDAGSSIVAFEEWLQLGEGERPEATNLHRIERYNRDDVVSNFRLRDWLEDRRIELAEQAGRALPRPVARVDTLPTDATESLGAVQLLVDRLTAGVPTDPAERDGSQAASWLLAQLLGWHRREDKAMWWEYYRLMELTPEQLVDESSAIGLLEPIAPVGEERRGKQRWRYRFPDQEYDLGRGAVADPAKQRERPNDSPFDWLIADDARVDPATSTVELTRVVGTAHPTALVPMDWIRTTDHRASIMEIGAWVADHGVSGIGPFQAGRDLLLGRAPRVGQVPGESLRQPGETDLEAACRLALALERTTLAIQGPPGSGKTYSGARMIVSLIAAGKRVGITATSHKVIGNLLRAALDAAHEDRVDIRAAQKADKDVALVHPQVEIAKNAADARARLDDGLADLVAGTSWLWTSSRMTDSVDVLFVDEAGQMSLANVLAVSRAAGNLVLLGDPQQLDQPLRGSHPPGADRSALAHILDRDATMPPDRGLFLETTWRLHPDLCGFTSEVFYEDRLEPESHLAVQRFHGGGPLPLSGTGPRLLSVESRGADNESPVEAARVADLVRSIVEGGSRWVDHGGKERAVGWDDVLVVAPYNAQVGAIRSLLPAEARVGTVDKFQGQEAPISIYSMTTSSPELAPRGMDFLYSRNRLNVATSRARCIALVAMSPELLRVRARTPDQMRLANAIARFAELAREHP